MDQDSTSTGGQAMATATTVTQPVAETAPVVSAPETVQSPVVGQPVVAQPIANGQPSASIPEKEKPVEISIDLPTNAYFLSGIRDFTLAMTKNMTGFSDQWAFRFQSVVDELCNNAIEHGSAPGEKVKITFISHPHESLEITVEDSGTGPNKYNAEQMRALFKRQKEIVQTQFLGLRGRGLAKIVSEWTDELVFEDREEGGLRVRVKKYLAPDVTSDPGAPAQMNVNGASPIVENSATIPTAV